jgi:hypothetical protein
MQKVKGVEKVQVSLNDGVTILDLKPANTVKLSDLRQVIKNNGFVSNEAQMTARGRVTTINGQATFEVAGSGERFMLVGTTPQPGASMEVTGRVDLSKPDQPRLFVKSGDARPR